MRSYKLLICFFYVGLIFCFASSAWSKDDKSVLMNSGAPEQTLAGPINVLYWSTKIAHFLLRIFKFYRSQITISRLEPLKIVIFHVSRHILLNKLPCWLSYFKNPIVFQATKETLNNCIIPTRTTHIDHTAIKKQKRYIN